MSDASDLAQLEKLIAQFQALRLRELHLRCEGLELHLSTDSACSSLARVASQDSGAPAMTRSPVTDETVQSGAKGEAEGTEEGAAHHQPQATASASRTSQSTGAAAAGSAAGPAEWPSGSTIIRAPYLGTFYRSPKPGSPPFVQVGSTVVAGSDLCLVEVMKLFTSLKTQIAGRVHAVLAQDGALVEADQPLFVLVPA